jgi:YggT family protein
VEGLATIILYMTRALTLMILADIIVSYILDPFHPIRRFLDSIVQPLLAPIRRVLPPAGMFDFSPIVLLILVEMIGRVLADLVA